MAILREIQLRLDFKTKKLLRGPLTPKMAVKIIETWYKKVS
jgi:hypothetical protein